MTKRNPTILVVDDNPANLHVLFEVFDIMNYDVLFASDSSTCFQILAQEIPNLILLDVMMPGINGFEICRRLKAAPETRDIPVIFMTVLNETVDKVKGFEMGAVDYITKPIHPEEVLARVKTHLTLQQLQNDLKKKNQELELKNAMLSDREIHLLHLVEAKTRKITNITVSLVNALESANALNDENTGNHIKKVGAYSAFLAEQLGCERSFVNRIKLYASLHDIGKVGLPDELLKKPGIYTPEEFKQMQQHVLFGASLLENEGIDLMARNIALYHHEKWEGSGYVHGLSGEAIPLEARIVAIADVYDALVSERVYKPAFSEARADQIIKAQAGKHFDPRLVETFFRHRDAIQDIRTSFS